MDYGFAIDLEKCVGCHGCSVACKAANGTPPGITRSHVVRGTEGTYPNAKRIIRPMLCMMCEQPLCVAACSTGASYMDDNGIVRIDKEKCDGCGSCVEACPYDARYLRESEDGYFGAELNEYEQVAYVNMPAMCADKCDFCIEHSEDGETPDPVCVKACMAEARFFGPLDEIKAMVEERGGDVYLPEEGTSPRVFYLPVINS